MRKSVQVTSLDDDFGTAGDVARVRVVDETYPYQRGRLWNLVADFLYYIVAPIPVWVISRVFGMRFVNRSAVRKLGGCYLYSNHSHWADVFIPYLLAYPRRAYVVAGAFAVTKPLARVLVPMAGGIPLNTTDAGKVLFREALTSAVDKGRPVMIAPEAHLWPYFNGIRDFSSRSFSYPVRTQTPVLPYVVTFRKRRWLTWRPPKLTITVGDPIMPQEWANASDPKQLLRDKVHTFMVTTVQARNSYAWIHYKPQENCPPAL